MHTEKGHRPKIAYSGSMPLIGLLSRRVSRAVERVHFQQCSKSAINCIEMDTENGFLCDETRKMHTERGHSLIDLKYL